MLLTSTLYSRLGIPHLAHVHCELLRDCYEHSCPIDERIRAIGRRAFLMSQSGRYDEAIAALAAIDPSIHKSLKFHQYIFLCTGLIKFRRAIRRYVFLSAFLFDYKLMQSRSDWPTCTHLLQSLQPSTDPTSDPLDPELSFLQHDAYIDYLIARGSYSKAFTAISALAQSLKEDNADILQRVSVLLMKADLFRKVGKPEGGFSVALRAASVSSRARLMPCLWTSVGMLGNILNSLGECASARRLLEAVLPQVCSSMRKIDEVVLNWGLDRLWRAPTTCSSVLYTRISLTRTWVLRIPTQSPTHTKLVPAHRLRLRRGCERQTLLRRNFTLTEHGSVSRRVGIWTGSASS